MEIASNLKMLAIATCCLALNLNSADAQVSDARMVNGWFLARIKAEPVMRDSCIAHTTFADGTKIELSFYTSGALGGKLSFENEDWSSLNNVELGGGGKPDPMMPIKVSFEGSPASPIEDNFRVAPRLVLRGSVLRDKPGLYKFFDTDPFGSLVISLAQASTLAVSSGDRIIGRWPLTGSKGAMLALLDCAKSVASDQQRRIENDPFRK